MLKTARIIVVLIAAVFLTACASDNLPGEYSAIMPVSNNINMQITLRLNPDYTFKMNTINDGHQINSNEQDGTYRIDKKHIITLRYNGDGIKYLKQNKDGNLEILTVDKKEIKGQFKDSYKLKKQLNLYF